MLRISQYFHFFMWLLPSLLFPWCPLLSWMSSWCFFENKSYHEMIKKCHVWCPYFSEPHTTPVWSQVEAALSFCDYVDNLCVYGDSFHNNVIALIVPNKPALLKLASEVLGDDNNGNDIVDGNQHQMRSFQDLCADPKMVAAVKKSLLDHGLKSGLQRVEIPTEIKLCREEWIPDNGLVTSALKIRRKQIQEYYHQDIIRMYSSSNNQSSKTTWIVYFHNND